MYIISQFSKVSGLTTKALRYYDEQNILKPSYRDKDTLYRYYNENDLKKAQLIKLLRSLDFSISEIKETLDIIKNENDLTYILQEKIKHIEKNISKEKELIKKINEHLVSTIDLSNEFKYKIDIEKTDKLLVASIRFSGKYSEMDKYVPLLYKLGRNCINGTLFNCYFDEECVDQADIEICLPIKKQISDKAIVCKYLPAIIALTTTHYGSYDTINLAYKTLFEYANIYNIKLLTPSREIYIKGPGMIFKGNPENYVTKILLPFEIF